MLRWYCNIFKRTFKPYTPVKTVLEQIEAAELPLKLRCSFACTKVQLLGHIVSKYEISVYPEKFGAISKASIFCFKSKLLNFIGQVPHYRCFIEAFHLYTMSPLPGVNNNGMTSGILLLKLQRKLYEPQFLSYYNFNKRFMLKTDASFLHLGLFFAKLRPRANTSITVCKPN